MRTARIVGALLGVTVLGITACGGSAQPGSSASATPVEGKTFTMAISTDPGNLNPLMTVLSEAVHVDRFLYAWLINVAPDGSAIPSLAEKWSATTTKATFTLRKGITCSDGTPLTAADVAGTINFVADPKNKSPLLGLQVMPDTKAAGNDDTRTITVSSGAPDPFLLRDLGTLPIVCGAGLKDASLLAKGKAGTGMFTLTQAVTADHYSLTRRKDFTWGPGDWKADQPGLPDKVVIKVVRNEATAANLLVSGGLNAATVVGPDRERLEARNLFHADISEILGEFFFNEAPGHPTSDEVVRRAMIQALDLPQLGKVLTGGEGTPSRGMASLEPRACSGDAVKGNLPDSDVDAAKAALGAAGWKAGSGGVRSKDGKKMAVTVIYPTASGPTMAAAAELIQQRWKAVGVDVKLQGLDSNGLNSALFQTGSFDVSMAPIGLSLPNQLIPFVSGPVPPKGTNFAHIQNNAYDRLAESASSQPGTEGCPDWIAAEQELIKSVNVVPYVDATQPMFGQGAKFAVDGSGLDPTTIRMTG